MLYKFKSQAAGDVIMLNDSGEQMLRILGKEVTRQGIVTVEQMPAAIAALNHAVVASETMPVPHLLHTELTQDDPVLLRQRVAPLVLLLRESQACGKDVVWGV